MNWPLSFNKFDIIFHHVNLFVCIILKRKVHRIGRTMIVYNLCFVCNTENAVSQKITIRIDERFVVRQQHWYDRDAFM